VIGVGSVIYEKVLGTVRRNRTRAIRVSVANYEGHVYLYAHIIPADSPGEKTMNYPGLTLSVETARQVIPLLTEALEIAEMREKARLDDRPEERRRR
jgi:hypothetical protein